MGTTVKDQINIVLRESQKEHWRETHLVGKEYGGKMGEERQRLRKIQGSHKKTFHRKPSVIQRGDHKEENTEGMDEIKKLHFRSLKPRVRI